MAVKGLIFIAPVVVVLFAFSRRRCWGEHFHKYPVKSIYFNHPSQGNSTNYYNYHSVSQRQGCASHKSTHRSVPPEASEVSTPSSIFIFLPSASFTGELSLLSTNHRHGSSKWANIPRTVLSEAFWTPNNYSFVAVRQILRTRFTKQTFAQLKTGFSQLVHVDGEPDLCTL